MSRNNRGRGTETEAAAFVEGSVLDVANDWHWDFTFYIDRDRCIIMRLQLISNLGPGGGAKNDNNNEDNYNNSKGGAAI